MSERSYHGATSFRLATRNILYAPPHGQDSTYQLFLIKTDDSPSHIKR